MSVDFPTIITGLIALAVVVDVCLLAYIGKPIPDIVKEFGFMVFGFYFGRGGRLPNGERTGATDRAR